MAGRRHWRVSIGIPGGFDIGIGGGFNRNTQFERDLLIERTQAGISRTKAAGKQFGRPPALNAEDRADVVNRLAAGSNVSELAREFKTTRQTIMRIREAALKSPQPGNTVNSSGE